MIIETVPEYKKIRHIEKPLNESLFDDNDDVFNINDTTSDTTSKIIKNYEQTELAPKVERFLLEFDIQNYEIKCTGHGILVDVHDNLYLPNKKLDKINFTTFKFDIVYGSCNFTGNNLTDWSKFPNVIVKNCYANFNNIKNFNGVPTILGKLIASKQNKKTEYPLTHENYINFKQHKLTENSVYAIPVNRFGLLYSLCEDNNSCIIKFNENSYQKFKLNEIEYLGNLENLLI